jgi:hypothetical protein
MYTMGSAIRTQASSSAASTGTYQRAGALSRRSQVSSSGTEVPMWPTDRSRAKTPRPNCGASMMPAAMRVLVQAARPEAPLLARTTASMNASV